MIDQLDSEYHSADDQPSHLLGDHFHTTKLNHSIDMTVSDNDSGSHQAFEDDRVNNSIYWSSQVTDSDDDSGSEDDIGEILM